VRQLIYFNHLRDKYLYGLLLFCDDQQLIDWVDMLKSNAPGRLEKVKYLKFNEVSIYWPKNKQLRDLVSGDYDKHLAIFLRPKCHFIHVIRFPSLLRLNFWLRDVRD
jgi:hypothetical protein